MPAAAHRHGAITGLGGMPARITRCFDDIIVLLLPSEILLTVAFIGPLVRIVESPVLPVQINMDITDPRSRRDLHLGGARYFITQKRVLRASEIGPRRIL